MREAVFTTKRAVTRFAKKHAKWLLPAIGLVAMASIMAVAANIPIPSGNASRFVPGVPTAPASLTVATKTDSQTLIVNFTAAGPNGGTISSYQYSTDNGATWRTRTDSGGTSTSMRITQVSSGGTPGDALVNGTDYVIRIRAVSNIGQGLASASITDWPIGAPVTAVVEGPSLGFGSSDYVYDMEVDASNGIIMVGSFAGGIKRFNADGSLDTSFNPGNEVCLGIICNFYTDGANGTIRTVDIDYSGKIIVGGSFTQYNNISSNRIARLLSDGSVDTTFTAGFDADVYGIESYPNGQYAVGGGFSNYLVGVTNTSKARLALLSSDGSLVSTFNTVAWGSGSVFDLVISPTTGNVTAVGSFASVNGSNLYQYAVRFKYSDGSLDTGFQVRSNGSIYTIETPPNSNLPYYIGGEFTQINNGAQNRNRLASVNTSGTDSGWNPNANGAVYDLTYHYKDGSNKIAVAGSFSTVSSTSRTDFAVLDLISNTVDSLNVTIGGSGVGQVMKNLPYGEYGIGGVFIETINGVSRNAAAIVESGGGLADGITLNNASMKVSFTGASTKAQPITTLQYSTDGGATWRNGASSVSPVTITTQSSNNAALVNGTSYSVRIRLLNSVNTVAATGTPSGTPCGKPSPPPSITIYGGNGESEPDDPATYEYSRALSWDLTTFANNGCAIQFGASSYAASTSPNPKGNVFLSGDSGGLYYVGGVDTMLMSNFTTSTTYYLGIQWCNIAGCSTPYTGTATTPDVAVCWTGDCTTTTVTTGGIDYTVTAMTTTGTLYTGINGATINYALVGGGGGGGRTGSTIIAGGGGAAGGIGVWLSQSIPSAIGYTITIGAAGSGATTTANGGSGGITNICSTCPGGRTALGGPGGAGTGAGVSGSNGSGGRSDGTATRAGGSALYGAPGAVANGGGYAGGQGVFSATTTNRVGGGGGGGGAAGGAGNGNNTGGAGGACYTTLSSYSIFVGGGGGGASVGNNSQSVGATCNGTKIGGDGAGRAVSGCGATGGNAATLPNFLGVSGFSAAVGSGGGGACNANGGSGTKGIFIIWTQKVV